MFRPASALHTLQSMSASPVDVPAATGTTVDLFRPEHANHHGTLFGGRALDFLTRAAFVHASREVRRPLVVAAVHDVQFVSPVVVGELIEAITRVERTGARSVTVVVDLYAENPVTGARRPAVTGRFIFVAVNETAPDPAGRVAAVGA